MPMSQSDDSESIEQAEMSHAHELPRASVEETWNLGACAASFDIEFEGAEWKCQLESSSPTRRKFLVQKAFAVGERLTLIAARLGVRRALEDFDLACVLPTPRSVRAPRGSTASVVSCSRGANGRCHNDLPMQCGAASG